ncbi:MAG: threonine--tRNA ligase [Candidatus Improbicoccus pseudotrichonymphae]|uniref:Threonine--tRNA ligase n=1 Tax=Candidatus Improbicoccus pseudotrichonymphae TaxID=3033792 RepID=A0AA48KX38_9FIRM|nr:MAG: threonine--tRNA ligase [Candidatus Improbicoccus pseudotrichonymphae]
MFFVTSLIDMEIVVFMELKVLRHTVSHIFAQALKRMYPDIKLAIGPPTNDGFYYDFDMEKKITKNDFPEIEEEMKKIIRSNYKIERFGLDYESAIEIMNGQPYKIEMIEDLQNESNESEELSFYKQEEYVDMCKGPHLNYTGEVNPKAVKLLSVAGAYWRGSEKNKMLQRVYGTAFREEKELIDHLMIIEESKKRDHRKLGKEMELFTFMEEGPGFPFFLPKGKIIRNELEGYWRKIHRKMGYEEISTPLILNEDLWRQSGHWEHYKDNMYFTEIDNKVFAIKPMNCPGSVLVYKLKPRSYKELPLRYAEMGVVHRHENSGNLHGLLRVRCFTQDDAHIFLAPEQIESQVIEIIDLIDTVYKKMGFEYFVELSTRPENSMGSDEEWELAICSLKKSLEVKNISYRINEGDGAFYGPKIDFHIKDCLSRTWQCGTIQLDFQMPERFGLTYIGSDGKKHKLAMIHRVVFGSIERFIAILLEHTAAKLPLWLSPIQVSILPITEKHLSYTKQVFKKLEQIGIRAEIDEKNDTFGKKLRDASLKKIPYIVIIGDNEVSKNVVTVKSRDDENQETISIENFINILNDLRILD